MTNGTIKRRLSYGLLALAASFAISSAAEAAEFQSGWKLQPNRFWAGGSYWTNPLQDWRIHDGTLECVNSGRNRNVNLLTHQLADREGGFRTSVHLEKAAEAGRGHAGFRIGIQGPFDGYRNAAIHGRGLDAGLTTDGTLFIGGPGGNHTAKTGKPLSRVELRLSAEPADGGYALTLTAREPGSGDELAAVTRENVNSERLVGNVALLCDYRDGAGRGQPRVRFSEWTVSGEKVAAHPERAFGPILFAQYTLSDGVLNITAQMAPVGEDSRTLRLQVESDGSWETVGRAKIDPLSRTATMRVGDWDDSRDVPYRLAYASRLNTGRVVEHFFPGTIRRNPVDKETITVAGFTGNKDTGFPNAPIVQNLRYHDPDVLVFTGDQIYEDVAGYGVRRTDDVELASLDYLRKWYLLGWAFGDLMRNRPTICLPDDHDVYQPNIWGESGRPVPTLGAHARGGYFMPPEWVNAVQRTQTAHFPAPYDPAPVKQGITVYFTDMNYGRISFAILEDRKFKTGPEGFTPPTDTGRPDHVQDPDFDPQTVDLPEARLLGDRQLAFLRDWAADWRNADMKCAVSQTIFANVPNIHGGNKIKLLADLDSNGWPQTPRNKALRALRKGFAFHLSGDQHLPMIVHYGVNEYGDAPYGFCVPSTAAGYPRAFRPDEPGRNRQSGMPDYTGQFRDGFDNKMTIWAVANPEDKLRKPVLPRLHDKASGYGLVRFHKPTQKITIECWPLLSDPSDPDRAEQFTGWPKTIEMEANYGRTPRGHLPTIRVSGLQAPVVQVIDEHQDAIVYTRRIRGTEFRPPVFKIASYTVKVGEPGTDRMKTLTGLRPDGERKTVEVAF